MGAARLHRLLERPGVTLLDGAMGSAIEDAGIDVANPLWGSVALLSDAGRSVNDAIHAAYVAAGAEILTLNTHNASWAHCRAYLERVPVDRLEDGLREVVGADADLDARATALLRYVHHQAAASARRVSSDGKNAIAGCLASPDRPYSTEASFSSEETAARLDAQVEVLGSGDLDLDLILFEMMTTRSDLEGVAKVVKGRHLPPIGVGIPCRADGCSLGGVSMAEVVRILEPARPTVLFVQCTPFSVVEHALRALAATGCGIPLGVYANDGRRFVDGRWEGERTSPETYADAAARWLVLGARIIGSCCGTGPAHIAALARRFQDRAF